MTWAKLKLLCWKNFLLQRRHPVAGLCEIIFPVLIALLFTYVRSQSPQRVYPAIVHNSSKLPDYESCTVTSRYMPIEKIGFSPGDNVALKKLLRKAVHKSIEVESFADPLELETFLKAVNKSRVGVEFDVDESVSGENLTR
jgi:ATP-binding cassette, subfamily A (ABC1), member 3